MKLLYCKLCQDVIKLVLDLNRSCSCGASGGKYRDQIIAEYWGENAVPFSIDDPTFADALSKQSGGLSPGSEFIAVPGAEFIAFVIPKNTEGIKFVKKSR